MTPVSLGNRDSLPFGLDEIQSDFPSVAIASAPSERAATTPLTFSADDSGVDTRLRSQPDSGPFDRP